MRLAGRRLAAASLTNKIRHLRVVVCTIDLPDAELIAELGSASV
jgi:hypothetical protein